MAFDTLTYTKDWTESNPASARYFPTTESNEIQVRSDMQLLFNDIKTWVDGLVLKLADCSNVGMGESSSFVATDVKGALLELKAREIDPAVIGSHVIINSNLQSKNISGESAPVGQGNIMDGAVGSNELANGSVTSAKLADGAISGSKLSAGSILSTHLEAGAVTSDKITNYAVTTDKLATVNNPTSGAAVGTINIKDGAVTNAKLAGGITSDKISSCSTGSLTGTISNGQLAGGITADKISTVSPSSLNTVVPVGKGGTGASDAGSARSNLGVSASGTVVVSGTTYTLRTGSSGAAGYITFVT